MTKRLLAAMWWHTSHQGGWDEALLIFGLPVVLFVVMRWLAGRKSAGDDHDGSD